MEKKYKIKGIKCSSCIEKIKAVLKEIASTVEVTLNPPLLKIHSPKLPSLETLNMYLSSIGDYQAIPIEEGPPFTFLEEAEEKPSWRTYYPLFLIAVYILGVSTISSFENGTFNLYTFMNYFMAGFFLVFSAFKFLNLKGFADAYATYDLLASRWHSYGYIYPFLELALGLGYLLKGNSKMLHLATFFLMGFSSLGVIQVLAKKQKIQCACLGTFLKVPMSVITLVEDLTMVVMAALSFCMI